MDEFAWFIRAFHELTGIDLARYKRPQMERRLTNLRDRRGFHDFPSYVQALKARRELLDELLDRMTINVSEFFRNPDRWKQLVPFLMNKHRPIRAWSAACSTGEEPYTLAILLAERNVRHDVILATDIDSRVLELARLGVYEPAQLREIDPALRERYFVNEQNRRFHLTESIKRKVEFRNHNLLADPYPENLDLIICRNVLIYFTDETKRLLVEKFTESLVPGGVLFVGSTEQLLGTQAEALVSVAPFMYQKSK
ncbi:CheR family methyltransferase [Alicyclobacillus acidiphilus]|uniref:CheR family methyltransferase n=1 Tax=Alicyclobacillus acidiphilus TaxID=182455 RepID=UPI0008317ED0|nr:protein-glutamate O-methyltransferase CheR [Alicyclobacillus acidiphilus]